MILYDFHGFKKLAVDRVYDFQDAHEALEESMMFKLCRVRDLSFDRYFYRGKEIKYHKLTIQKSWVDAANLQLV